ncbi:MAG: DUF1259 domain-containing protein [Gammaproteobacteria bacterium]|nr:DUF1259 domain-containing protein [Gammaproteobacteria bacterium]
MHCRRIRFHSFLTALWLAASPGGEAAPLSPEAIERASGLEPSIEADGVLRIGWSRDDVEVSIEGRRLPPAAGLGSWAAFKSTPDGVMVMGDTVVFEDEITPAMDAALAHGLDVTALHNHFVFDRPPVYFMHIGARGDANDLAGGVAAVWDAIRSVRKAHPQPQERFPGGPAVAHGELDAETLEGILGSEPSVNDGVVKFTFARTGRMHGAEIGGSMGLSTWAAFVGAPESATVDGDFIMTADEVQQVLRALRRAGIHIVALHNHMIGEEPPFYFLHYWGKGTTKELARGVKSALKETKPELKDPRGGPNH